MRETRLLVAGRRRWALMGASIKIFSNLVVREQQMESEKSRFGVGDWGRIPTSVDVH